MYSYKLLYSILWFVNFAMFFLTTLFPRISSSSIQLFVIRIVCLLFRYFAVCHPIAYRIQVRTTSLTYRLDNLNKNLIILLLTFSNPFYPVGWSVDVAGTGHNIASDSAVCIIRRSQALKCAYRYGVWLRGVHHSLEPDSAVGTTLRAESSDTISQKTSRCL